MEAEYSQKKNRIKLRVTTSTGLNLLCTANRSQKIKELLPHIIKLYEEVKQDQGLTQEFGQASRPFIKFIRKEEFLIAPSELVGDIFDDNDEVFCEIGNDTNLNSTKKEVKQVKKEKVEKKQPIEKQDASIPKTKKIKKKNPKTNDKTPSKQDVKSQLQIQPIQEKQIKIIQKVQPSKLLAKKIQQQVKQTVQVKQTQQNKNKKKKKNKNNTKQHQPLINKTPEQKIQPVQNKQPKKQVITETKNVQKKSQPNEQKSSVPLISSDELLKIKQMMKKSSTLVAEAA